MKFYDLFASCYSCKCVHLDQPRVRHLYKFLSPLVQYLSGSKCKTWKRTQNLSSKGPTYVRKPLHIENEFKIRSDCFCVLIISLGIAILRPLYIEGILRF
jgi:hypothetical protein